MFNRLRKGQRGQSLVEFALVLPLLIILLMGIFEFGRIFSSYVMITNAAREGARNVVVGRDDSQVSADILNMAGALDVGNVTVVINPGGESRVRGSSVTVEVAGELEIITPVIGKFMPNPFPVMAVSTMRME
ncbi:MAG TPA: TadE/TadG family type IV pilus assembly protein [Clostridia bacterium]|nr:TadE/TadG family type IV pilus assembly protein [Clostridia bacterium]